MMLKNHKPDLIKLVENSRLEQVVQMIKT